MSEDLLRLVYHSRHGGLSSSTIKALVEEAADLSQQFGITGFIAIGHEDFLVLMEGDPLTVVRGIVGIDHDPRHTDLRILSVETVSSRLCTRWKVIGAHDFDRCRSGVADGPLDAVFDPSKLAGEQVNQIVASLVELA